MRLSVRSPFAILVLAALVLGACTTSGPAPGPPSAPPPSSAPPGVTPNTFALPTGAGCAGEVARFQAVMDNDIATGHTTRPVYDRVSAEIATARATCAAGNEAGAIGQINATKARFGYR
jgi:hypothetical protein